MHDFWRIAFTESATRRQFLAVSGGLAAALSLRGLPALRVDRRPRPRAYPFTLGVASGDLASFFILDTRQYRTDQPGYVRCTMTPDCWTSDYRVVPFVTRPGAPIQTRASFVVEDGQPGATPA